MKRIVVILMLSCSGLLAAERKTDSVLLPSEDGRTLERITYDKVYSFRAFSGPLTDVKDWEGLVVYASVFAHEVPDTLVFPKEMRGVTFVKCNLDNVVIPEGNTVVQCSQKRYCVQNDLRDWEVDKDNKPTKVIDAEIWNSKGYSTDVKDIPTTKIRTIEEVARK